MPEEIRLWRIDNKTQLKSLEKSKLDLEERLEAWLDSDISILADDLIVINRQTQTAFGGVIDLLCLDRNGDVVIVELKRHKTPREITAQVLDYASWVKDLSRDALISRANDYLAKKNSTLEEVFRKSFGAELPEILNENHRMLIVASEIDGSSERIIKYLSDNYGVNINAATFHYFRTENGDELLARIFLIEPETVEYKAQTKGESKRTPNITYTELEEQAEEAGVGELYRQAFAELSRLFGRHTTASSVAFNADLDGSKKVVFSLRPAWSSRDKGLHFQIYTRRFEQHFKMTEEQILAALPSNLKPWKQFEGAGPDYAGVEGYFIDQASLDRCLDMLRKIESTQ